MDIMVSKYSPSESHRSCRATYESQIAELGKGLDAMVKCPPCPYQRPDTNPHPNTPRSARCLSYAPCSHPNKP